MSEYAARQALERMNMREVAIAASYTMLGNDLHQLANANHDEQQKKWMEQRRQELCEAYGFSSTEQRKPFAFADGMAIIPIVGTLINRFGSSYGWITGYNFIRRQLALAVADDEVKGIILDVNSYGGEAAGCFELSEEIYQARAKKPIMAVIDSNCYSAGYALASGATTIVCTPSGGVGSIGVVAMHVDMSKALAEYGYKVTFIHFGEHKVDGNPYEPLSAEVKGIIQKSVNQSGEKFVALVARNRNIDAAKVKETQARVYRAEDAKDLGLIDTIATPTEAVQVFLDELTGSVQQPGKEDAMSQAAENQPDAAAQAAAAAATATANAAAIATASAEARKAEKARISAITGSEEAKGKSKLANHLAMNTDMSVDDAKAMLAVAAAEATEQASGNAFREAMNQGNNPEVGAETGGSGGEGGSGESVATRMMRSHSAATGLKLVSNEK